jgi:hypothetical protein
VIFLPDNILKTLWKISIGTCSVFGPDMDFEIINKHKSFWKKVQKNKMGLTKELLFGVVSTDSNIVSMVRKTSVLRFVKGFCNVFNKEDLELRLDEYLRGSNVSEFFNKRRSFLISLPPEERIKYINSLKEKDIREYTKFSLINQYDKSLPKSGVYAFDLSNYTSLSRLGGFLDYIDENKVHKYLEKSALLAQKNYSSFREFAISSTVGILFSEDIIDKNYYDMLLLRLKKLLTYPESYFKNLDWNQKL